MVANAVEQAIHSSSSIRKMFDAGMRLRKEFGADNVFDFSLGNPHLEPPAPVLRELRAVSADPAGGMHRYMPIAGFESVRSAVARWTSRWQRVDVPSNHVVMTAGAACGLNVALKSVLNPGDGVVIPTPMFSEYPAYVANAGGVCQWVETTAAFDLDLEKIASAIDERTRAVLINSPNNPTGKIYSRDKLTALSEILTAHSKRRDRPIVLITDEVYWRVVFDDCKPPPIFQFYPSVIAAASFSKDLGLAGERIGFLAVHPNFPEAPAVVSALEHCLRTLGFVNANALMQRLIERCLEIPIELAEYRANRELMYDGLTSIGYRVVRPQGSLFMFPQSPIPDDAAFVERLMRERILAVPGSAFRRPGCFRLSFAAPPRAIEASMEGFRRAFEACAE